jgi:hypothetical protein
MCQHQLDELCPLAEWDNDPNAVGYICIACGEEIHEEPEEYVANRDDWLTRLYEAA